MILIDSHFHTHPRTSSIALGCSSQQLLPMVGAAKFSSHMRLQAAVHPTPGKRCCTASTLVGLLQQSKAVVYRGRFLTCNKNLQHLPLITLDLKLNSLCSFCNYCHQSENMWKNLWVPKSLLKFSGVCKRLVVECKSPETTAKTRVTICQIESFQVLASSRQYGKGSP